ncbi:ATP-binding cassette domain-containing protein [Sediminibacterium soli]|uniref:ATP-binding cassette domain-containing protein n=1 Tax=Sediminibacterium soli TaxID=2698829 RepID=UPI001379F70C|nr:ATP-binding cassette domain-containing protein [Sediminibacterium soli]NCI47619.1 ATP-binding cassette domain-containing protein [Sediminibacterium soli]
MRISFTNIIPLPLRDRLTQRSSDIWNTTLTLEQGEWVKIKAPSGTGKTTLIHIVYRLRQDYEGKIYFDDDAIDSMKDESIAGIRQQKMAIVFQDLRLFPQLSCRENIQLKRVMQDPVYAEPMIDTMAEALGVSHIMEQKAGICSYGEQQRVAIIRSLMQPFEWLVMDEPFSHLDQVNTAKAVQLITTECKKRNAGLLITDLEEDNHFTYTRQLQL